jgi:hypothetical protein
MNLEFIKAVQRDRGLWLDPAQRGISHKIWLQDYIGFRCAMSRTKAEQKDHQEIKVLYIIPVKAL